MAGASERTVLDGDFTSSASCFWHDPKPRTIEAAVLCTLAYADLFDYPLTVAEIHRYLVGLPADQEAVESLLDNGCTPDRVARCGTYYTLPGRERVVETRCQREQVAARLWPHAIRYGRAIARLPFVRMVAITGALAVDNVASGDDVDYLIVTAPDRLWLCRAMIIQFVVKPTLRLGVKLCPNYLLSERALTEFEHDLFTAHEIVQMVPIAGREIYQRLCRLNDWAANFLPNAYGRPRRVDEEAPVSRAPSTVVEPVLSSPIGNWLERWEMKRKIDRFDQRDPRYSEINFSADCCKAHFESHGRLTREALSQRLAALTKEAVS